MKASLLSEKTLSLAFCPKCDHTQSVENDAGEIRCSKCKAIILNFDYDDVQLYPPTAKNVATLTIDWHGDPDAKYTRTRYFCISPAKAAEIARVQFCRGIPVQITYEDFSADIIAKRQKGN